MLYKKYQELVAEGKFESVLQEIYHFGHLKQWDIEPKESEHNQAQQQDQDNQLKQERDKSEALKDNQKTNPDE